MAPLVRLLVEVESLQIRSSLPSCAEVLLYEVRLLGGRDLSCVFFIFAFLFVFFTFVNFLVGIYVIRDWQCLHVFCLLFSADVQGICPSGNMASMVCSDIHPRACKRFCLLYFLL